MAQEINIRLVAGTTAQINGTAIYNGQWLFDTEALILYIDMNNKRYSYFGTSSAQTLSYDDTKEDDLTLNADNVQVAIDALKTLASTQGTKITTLTPATYTQTLSTGSTSITFNLNNTLESTDKLRLYCQDGDVSPKSHTSTTNSVTYNFKAQSKTYTFLLEVAK